jgi:hypothetical protein
MTHLNNLTGIKTSVAFANVVQNTEDDMLFSLAYALDLTFHKDPQQLVYATSGMRAAFEDVLKSKKFVKAFRSTTRVIEKKANKKRVTK